MSDTVREDKEKMQALLTEIAGALMKILPENWDRVTVGYFLTGEDRTSRMQVIASAGREETDLMEKAWKQRSMRGSLRAAEDAAHRLHEHCAAAGDDWSEMTFVLKRSGDFTTDYRYEPIAAYDGAFILDWQSRALD